jgi:hypothetical protein
LGANTTINLFEDLWQHCADRIAKLGYTRPAPTGRPAHEDAFRLLTQLHNALARRIVQRKRKAHWSSELKERVLPSGDLAALQRIERAVGAGEDLNPWLSMRITKLNGRDLLLYDWGIHHLHLGLVEVLSGFRGRRDDVLFAKVTLDDLFFLDVGRHGEWAEDRFLEIMLADWPDLLAPYRTAGRDLQPKLTVEERQEAREAGLLTMVELSDGWVYAPPGGGINTAGTSLNGVTWADAILGRVGDVEQHVVAQLANVRAALAKTHGAPAGAGDLEFHLVISGDERSIGNEWSIYEARTKTRLPITWSG